MSLALVAAAPSGLGETLGLWTVVPFALLLLTIAVLPLVAHHWWESNRNKALVSAVLSAPIVVLLLAGAGPAGSAELTHKLQEYGSFMLLLGALFVIAGNVHIGGSAAGTPLSNTGVLAFGALIASVVGTTGASVLLIRPFLRANATRTRKVHLVVFFIFIVSNCGGLLTPLGDPPLFLGYLKGVPFDWTLRLWREWLFVNGALLVLFNFWDQRVLDREELERAGSQLEQAMVHAPIRVVGKINFVYLLGVVAVIYGSGSGRLTGGAPWPFWARDGALLGLALASWLSTRPETRRLNRFSWAPIVEVAVLFAGIFATMTPALLILNAWSQGQREVFGLAFGMREPWQFFWSTGLLSSLLDNAPTYLTFSSAAAGLEGVPLDGRFLAGLLAHTEDGNIGTRLLEAISCGAVFMGANTYIGNGPNFMVKAIAEEDGVRMPSFFGFMVWAGAILMPLFVLVTLIFFR